MKAIFFTVQDNVSITIIFTRVFRQNWISQLREKEFSDLITLEYM